MILVRLAEEIGMSKSSQVIGKSQVLERKARQDVLSLRAGRMLGDFALLQDKPQGFTATCTQDFMFFQRVSTLGRRYKVTFVS